MSALMPCRIISSLDRGDTTRCPYCAEVPRERREQAIYRTLDGESQIVAALRFGVPRGCVSEWISAWENREGPWEDAELSAYEVARGCTIRIRYNDAPYVRAPGKKYQRQPVNTFLKMLALEQLPHESKLLAAFAELSNEQKAQLTPVFDLALESLAYRSQAVLAHRRAREVVAGELAQSTRGAS